MKNRLYLVLGVLLVAGAVAGLWWWTSWEPVYEGKPLSYWIAPGGPMDYESPLPPTLVNDSNAIPFLIAALKRRDGSFEQSYVSFYVNMSDLFGVRRHLPVPYRNARIRFNSLCLLNRMEAVAKPAIPAIVRLIRQERIPSVRVEAAKALGQFGGGDTAVIAALNEALRDRDFGVRSTATNSLLKLDPEAAAKAGVKKPSP